MDKFNNHKQKRAVAIKVNGILKDSRIGDNTCINMDLLEADGVENSSIDGNKMISFDGSPINNIEIIGRDKMEQHGDKNKASIENKKSAKESFLNKVFWRIIIAIVVGLAVIYFASKFGWR